MSREGDGGTAEEAGRSDKNGGRKGLKTERGRRGAIAESDNDDRLRV